MTTTPPIERDTSGRFVKPEVDEPNVPVTSGDMHPMSRVLFGWVDAPRTPLILFVAAIVISVALIVVDLALNRDEYIEVANITGFYGLWGFGAFSLAVLAGWPLGKLLRRSEDYYGEADTTPQDVEDEQ